MITREELEHDRQDVINQLNRLQGALAYVNQKISALDKVIPAPIPPSHVESSLT